MSDEEQVSMKQAKSYSTHIEGELHITSAKDGTGVYELFQCIANKLLADLVQKQYNVRLDLYLCRKQKN